MHYGELKKCDIANGIGVRVTLFVSGCTNRCPDCFQPQTWDFDYGKEFTEDTKAEIFAELDKPLCKRTDGAGRRALRAAEPAGAAAAAAARSRPQYPGKTIWGFTGFTAGR